MTATAMPPDEKPGRSRVPIVLEVRSVYDSFARTGGPRHEDLGPRITIRLSGGQARSAAPDKEHTRRLDALHRPACPDIFPASGRRQPAGVQHPAPIDPAPLPRAMTKLNEHRRSVAFLEHGDEPWTCYLVTFPTDEGTWHGYFSFRPGHGEVEVDEVRTTDIFVEASEAEISYKARSLGRPLLAGLLESSLHTSRANGRIETRLRGRFRTLLTENAVEIAGDWTGEQAPPPTREELDRLRSLYASYRLDQVAHLICLVDPRDFEEAVDEILRDGSIDFHAKDRVQYAMMVVDHLERLLPLPDFETWAGDFLDNPEAYRLYTHTLHREGRLP